ncbi:MAG: hypothetical protein V7K89_27750 [Nostoc sp.]|uniref:hypothetical protein n=1 Tax=Nostoc sp. TaxID=1180 RepID=UPI002FF64521
MTYSMRLNQRNIQTQVDALDVITQCPPFFAQGYWRNIQLRDGLKISLGNMRMCDRFQTDYPEGKAGGV